MTSGEVLDFACSRSGTLLVRPLLKQHLNAVKILMLFVTPNGEDEMPDSLILLTHRGPRCLRLLGTNNPCS